MWVRGLKPNGRRDVQPYDVAPYVGAWIETNLDIDHVHGYIPSHPMWVRGLKQFFVLTVQSYKAKLWIIVLASNIPI